MVSGLTGERLTAHGGTRGEEHDEEKRPRVRTHGIRVYSESLRGATELSPS